MARRKRSFVKLEWKPGWRYVRERQMDPQFCAKGSYRTLSKRNVPSMPEGVLVVTCCPRSAKRNARGQCCSKGSCASSRVQAIRHSVERFRFRHKPEWRALMEAKPNKKGIRTVRGGKGPRRRTRRAG